MKGEGWKTGHVQERTSAGKDKCRKEQVEERRGGGKERWRKGEVGVEERRT